MPQGRGCAEERVDSTLSIHQQLYGASNDTGSEPETPPPAPTGTATATPLPNTGSGASGQNSSAAWLFAPLALMLGGLIFAVRARSRSRHA